MFDWIPLPIVLGIIIWIFSISLFSLLIFLFNQSSLSSSYSVWTFFNESNNLVNLPYVIGNSNEHQFTSDSLSLLTSEHQLTNINPDEMIKSFYLDHVRSFIDTEKNCEQSKTLPLMKQSMKFFDEKKTNSLSRLATRRSIIKDLNDVSDSKIHQSIDSLYSKDSLFE